VVTDPAVVALLLLAAGLHVRATRRLGRRGFHVPAWQTVAWMAGLLLVGVALASPVDTLSEELLSLHMAQHLLIADLAAPLLLAGMRWPVHVHLLPKPVLVPLARARVVRRAFAVLRRPLVAVPVYVLVLYAWHLEVLFEAALEIPAVHALQHQSFVLISVLVWWAALEPTRRHLRGELWKIPHVLAARVGGMFLGMAFILMRSPAYDPYRTTTVEHGLSPVEDQQLAGALMLSLDFFVVLFVLGFFFWRAGLDHDARLA
jgi:putative membrane protein